MKVFIVAMVALWVAVVVGLWAASQADAHSQWTCRHGNTSHVASLVKIHETRFETGFRRGGNHYHRYSYWVYTYGQGWEFRKRLVRLCNGTH